ncbi:hypothetical protein RN001_014453 [Aquatica leii]|uniref:CLIP domain-containing serine protease n=1 Tax=Aquatica leii TaxID=1421715 RepID=A0AAN7NY29_9COLE|nr:hypothetical protein RN001_014453 [Aquatica leii]
MTRILQKISVGLILLFILPVTYQEVDDEEWKKADACKTPDGENGKCVQLFSCSSLLPLITNPPPRRVSYVKKFECGYDYYTVKVCCPRTYHYDKNNVPNTSLSDKRFCGYQHTDDYFSLPDKTDTGIDEFPWVAALMHLLYNGRVLPVESIYCQGALINERYVLTSAGCIIDTEQILNGWVRLGEYHSKNKTDCVNSSYGVDCNEPEDVGIEETFIHPFYNKNDYVYPRINDVGLLRLNRSIVYSEYIRPICLPIDGTVFPQTGDVLYSSGWATTTHSEGKSIVKRKSAVSLIDNVECRKLLGSKFPPIAKINTIPAANIVTNYFMCALGKKVLCSYTDGEPMMFTYKNQWYLAAISSWNVPCNTTVPARYTRIVNYLDWIRDSIQTLNLQYTKKRN